MSGAVGITANDSSRYTLFTVSMTKLVCPPNTAVVWSLTSDRVLGRNSCVRQALAVGAEWLLFLDDDMIFPHDLLKRLLVREEMIVGSLYLQRHQPFAPIAYSDYDPDKGYTAVDLREYQGDELVEVEAVGTGGMLIRSEVFKILQDPWFEHHATQSEDLVFSQKARAAGIPIHVDLGARMGHMSACALWPTFNDDEWWIAFDVADGVRLPLSLDFAMNATEVEVPA